MEDKRNALSVYNALNNTNYTNFDDVEIVTLEKGISLTVRNDAAFIVDAALSVYEHQSTICPNMPVRNLIYYTTIVKPLVKKHNIFGRKLVKIPIPKFAVFYNGDEDQPEEYNLRLSDAFEQKADNPELELICKVYNINYGKNRELLEKCPVLKGYMYFVDAVKQYYSIMNHDDLELAIHKAIDLCIKNDILADFFSENRNEVVKVTTMDYTFDKQITMERIEAREEGHEAGLKQGLQQGLQQGREVEIIGSIRAGDYSIERGAEKLGISVDEMLQKLADSPVE